MKKMQGFTLIELMIVVLIVGLMLLVASPFTGAWSDSARLTEAKGVWTEAIGRAKAAALRNPAGVSTTAAGDVEVAAAVCITNAIEVRGAIAGVPATAAAAAVPYVAAACPSTGNLLWSSPLINGVSIEGADADDATASITCLQLDNRGFAVGSNTCAIDTQFKLSSGSVEEDARTYY